MKNGKNFCFAKKHTHDTTWRLSSILWLCSGWRETAEVSSPHETDDALNRTLPITPEHVVHCVYRLECISILPYSLRMVCRAVVALSLFYNTHKTDSIFSVLYILKCLYILYVCAWASVFMCVCSFVRCVFEPCFGWLIGCIVVWVSKSERVKFCTSMGVYTRCAYFFLWVVFFRLYVLYIYI